MKFNEIWDEYIAAKKIRVKPSTLSSYVHSWKQLKPDFGELEIE